MDQLVALGATHVAWGVDPSFASELELSRQIVDRARRQRVGTVVLVCEPRIEALERVALDVAPDFLLVAAEHIGSGIDEQDLPGLADRIRPRTALMMSVPVRVAGSRSEMGSLAAADRYQAFAGALILDTRLDPEDGAHCGCTGRTNDWEICADIVRRARCPVMLAGGLSPENVAEAVRRVRPWGVDACSSLERPDHSKDLDACLAFVRAAASAHAEQPAHRGVAEVRAEP
ncbi:phosphoribosylanthranilate isomerase [Sorangium sp. So ce1151]|uniref:phosphoribosylanthranilate isomerase n=1 Tax=Sorangium sp. So ce1151 TaxID=3133332 RepID=UPI003F636529